MEQRKRARFGGSHNGNSVDEKSSQLVCSFCKHSPAAVVVESPHLRKQQKRPFCLLHYYTTSASRANESKVVPVDDQVVEEQLRDGMIQELFAQAFTELQHDLASESARAFQSQQTDPLAVLHDLRGRPKKRPPLPNKQGNVGDDDNAGGFLKSISLPERLVQTQQKQAQLQSKEAAQWQRSQEVSKKASPYDRRKPSRKSIWSMALDPTVAGSGESVPASDINSAVTCTCGSTQVYPIGNVTSRNQDLRKGETWGMKDRSDDVVARYQCQKCGKIWMQEG
jgi:hypothetical protein